MSTTAERAFGAPTRRHWGEAIAARGGIVLVASALLVFLTLPLATLLVRSFENADGAFVGLANFASYFASPAVGSMTLHQKQQKQLVDDALALTRLEVTTHRKRA